MDIRRTDGLGVLGIGSSGQLLMATNSFMPGFEEDWLPGHMARFDMDTGALDTVASYDLLSRPPPGLRWSPAGAGGMVTSRLRPVRLRAYRQAGGHPASARRHRDPDRALAGRAGTPGRGVASGASGPDSGRATRMASPGAPDAVIERMTGEDMAVYRAGTGGPVPLFTIAFGDAAGRVWLPSYRPGDRSEGAPGYTVVSAGGEWLGTAEAPPGFRILGAAGGLVLGVHRDDTDVESVVVYELAGALGQPAAGGSIAQMAGADLNRGDIRDPLPSRRQMPPRRTRSRLDGGWRPTLAGATRSTRCAMPIRHPRAPPGALAGAGGGFRSMIRYLCLNTPMRGKTGTSPPPVLRSGNSPARPRRQFRGH